MSPHSVLSTSASETVNRSFKKKVLCISLSYFECIFGYEIILHGYEYLAIIITLITSSPKYKLSKL